MSFVDSLRATCARIDSADAAFFARWQGRKYRLRQTHPVELEFLKVEKAAPGKRWFSVLERGPAPVGTRCLLEGPRDAETDVDDEMIDFILFCSERGISI